MFLVSEEVWSCKFASATRILFCSLVYSFVLEVADQYLTAHESFKISSDELIMCYSKNNKFILTSVMCSTCKNKFTLTDITCHTYKDKFAISSIRTRQYSTGYAIVSIRCCHNCRADLRPRVDRYPTQNNKLHLGTWNTRNVWKQYHDSQQEITSVRMEPYRSSPGVSASAMAQIFDGYHTRYQTYSHCCFVLFCFVLSGRPGKHLH